MEEMFLVNCNVGVCTINRRIYFSPLNYFVMYYYWTNRLMTWIKGTNVQRQKLNIILS